MKRVEMHQYEEMMRGLVKGGWHGRAIAASLGEFALLKTNCICPYKRPYSKQRIKVMTVLQEGKEIQFQSQIKQRFQLEQIMFSVSRTAFFPARSEFNFSNRLYFVTSVTSRWPIS